MSKSRFHGKPVVPPERQWPKFRLYRIDYPSDCRRIQDIVQRLRGVHLPIEVADAFWEWRSDQWSASWLILESRHEEEIAEWFDKWVDETGQEVANP